MIFIYIIVLLIKWNVLKQTIDVIIINHYVSLIKCINRKIDLFSNYLNYTRSIFSIKLKEKNIFLFHMT